MNGLGEALSRFNSASSESPHEKEHEKPGHSKDETSKHGGGKYHRAEIHAHKDGSHHLTVHHGGQMIHHSEHGSVQEATDALHQHLGGGGMEAGGGGPEEMGQE